MSSGIAFPAKQLSSHRLISTQSYRGAGVKPRVPARSVPMPSSPVGLALEFLSTGRPHRLIQESVSQLRNSSWWEAGIFLVNVDSRFEGSKGPMMLPPPTSGSSWIKSQLAGVRQAQGRDRIWWLIATELSSG